MQGCRNTARGEGVQLGVQEYIYRCRGAARATGSQNRGAGVRGSNYCNSGCNSLNGEINKKGVIRGQDQEDWS